MSRWRAESGYFGRYVGSGGVNTLIGFAVIFLLMWLGASPMWANVAGYAVGFTLGFVLSKKFVFRSNGHFAAEGVRYLLAFAVAFVLNLLVLHYAMSTYSLHAVPAQFVASACYTLLMYLLSRTYVFSKVRTVDAARHDPESGGVG